MIRQKQEDDRAAFKRHQEEDRKRMEEERNRTKEELLLKRQEYKEKTKNAVLFSESFGEKKKGSSRNRNSSFSFRLFLIDFPNFFLCF